MRAGSLDLASTKAPRRWASRWVVLVLALAALILPGAAFAAPAMAPNGGGAAAAADYEAPADHPVVSSRKLELPTPPVAFNSYDGGWIRFAYPPNMRERIQPLIAEADAFRRELSDRFGHPVLDDVVVYVARTPGEMSTLAPEGAPYPKYASGVAYSSLGLVLLTLTPENPGDRHDLLEVFKHELSHVGLYDAIGSRHSVPRWFNEGFAVHASGEGSMARLQTLWTATLSGNLLPLSRLEGGFPGDGVTAGVAYAQSADIVRFLMRQSDTARFGALIARLRRGEAFSAALENAYGLDRASLEYEWREDVARRYSFWPVFFSGSLIWMGVLGLFVVGWRRRKKRAQTTLDRWSREEAIEDARIARAQVARIAQEQAEAPAGRVHIVFPVTSSPERVVEQRDSEVPKVEHEGDWHTLH